MPALQMKAKLSTVSLIDKKFLGVCEKSSVIAKRSCTHTTYSRPTTESELCIQKCLDTSVSSRMDLQTPDDENGKVICLQEMPIGEDLLFQNQSLMSVDSCTMRRMESINCTSNLETIFSHLEPAEVHSAPNIDDDAGYFGRYLSNFPETNGSEIKFSEIEGSNNDLNVPGLKADGGDDNTKLSNCQTCNVSDFFISDMIITGLPFDGNTVDDITKTNPLHDYKCTEPNMFFDVADECMILPFLEDTAKVSDSNDAERWESVVTEPDSSNLYLAIHQIRSCNQDPDLNTNSGQTEDFDPQSFIRSLPELTDVVTKFEPITLPNESGRRKSTTLVLDLDETLVHSTLEHCDDADFTFTIFFNMKEHIVYVKQRPYLHAFLERVADMFEVVIFTASQSIYAGQLLDILDPEKKLISRRVYRESCIFSDGTYTKDLTVLGVDLAKVAIIDNSPQVFRLQVNNGIPIKSWFSDPSDCALIALLPFLEMLVDADDVRPIIAKRFGNRD